jgi:hypothetical protein
MPSPTSGKRDSVRSGCRDPTRIENSHSSKCWTTWRPRKPVPPNTVTFPRAIVPFPRRAVPPQAPKVGGNSRRTAGYSLCQTTSLTNRNTACFETNPVGADFRRRDKAKPTIFGTRDESPGMACRNTLRAALGTGVNDGKRSEAARLAEIEVIAAKAARQVTAAASAARSAPSAAARHSPSSWSLDPGNVTASFECCLDAHP